MNKITVLTLTILLALVGCQNPAGSTPVAPVASALFTTVSLTAVPASGATFSWTQVSGPTVSITGSTSSSASFIPTVVGTYMFNVSENGVASNSVSVSIANPAWASTVSTGAWNHSPLVVTFGALSGSSGTATKSPALSSTFAGTWAITGVNTITVTWTSKTLVASPYTVTAVLTTQVFTYVPASNTITDTTNTYTNP